MTAAFWRDPSAPGVVWTRVVFDPEKAEPEARARYEAWLSEQAQRPSTWRVTFSASELELKEALRRGAADLEARRGGVMPPEPPPKALRAPSRTDDQRRADALRAADESMAMSLIERERAMAFRRTWRFRLAMWIARWLTRGWTR